MQPCHHSWKRDYYRYQKNQKETDGEEGNSQMKTEVSVRIDTRRVWKTYLPAKTSGARTPNLRRNS